MPSASRPLATAKLTAPRLLPLPAAPGLLLLVATGLAANREGATPTICAFRGCAPSKLFEPGLKRAAAASDFPPRLTRVVGAASNFACRRTFELAEVASTVR